MHKVEQQRFEPVLDRACGKCTACCTWLGIEELKKYTGTKCKYLRGPAHATKRCSIYHHRPVACSGYTCMWREGWGPAEWQPKNSGILITPYPDRDDPNLATITMNIFDMVKADPYINEISSQLILLPFIIEVRVINLIGKKALLYKNGCIYKCQLLPAEGFEELIFMAEDDPVGHYEIRTE
jgi:hypothetical protein